uniref:Phospholipase A2 n=1 Tax=Amazona collaria TaxID=241587 RepID=A0A8B9EXW4_9PSIT
MYHGVSLRKKNIMLFNSCFLLEQILILDADCYVSLWLPTASTDKCKTKTISNCKDPIWNETFYFRIQSQVKVLNWEFPVNHDLRRKCLVLSFFHVLFMLRTPELHTILQVRSHESRVKGQEHLPRPAGHTPFDAAQNTVGPLGCKRTLPAHVHFFINPHPQVLLHRAALNLLPAQSVAVPGIAPTQVEDFAFSMLKLHQVGISPPHKRVKVPLDGIPSLQCINRTTQIFFFPDLCSSPDHLDVRLGFDLCMQEQDFLRKRQRYVAPALKKLLQLEHDLLDHEIPVVAIMTTGGGMRSLTALYGSLRGLKKLDVLDCATYLTGLSGTTWTMSNLYRDANWSQKDLDKQISEARKHVTKRKMNSLSLEYLNYYKKQLSQRKKEGRKTSFIDLWSLVLESFLHDGKDNHRLSDQQRAIDRGQNPLPIYTAVNVKSNYSTLDFKEWVEFTPYEVGLQKYGAFVRTEDFGSEFFMGRLMKKIPESRICFLEGVWSSLFSFNVLYIWNLSHSSEDFWHRWTQDKIDNIGKLSYFFLTVYLFTLRSALTDRVCIAQDHNFLKGLQVHNDYLENKHFCRWKDTVLDTFPNQLTQSEEFLSLVDTGFFINTSIMPLLKPERKVDIILHLNYSAGSQTQTCKYCSEQGILFPKVDLSEEDNKNLKECYLFDGAETPGAPVLLFFPLINDTFQKYKAPGQKRSESEMDDGKVDLYSSCSPYSTYSFQYTEKVYDHLVQLGEYNVLNNKDLIMKALHTAVARKRQKKK